MKYAVAGAADGSIALSLDRTELRALQACVEEALGGIDVREFSTRVGASTDEAAAILATLRALPEPAESAPRPRREVSAHPSAPGRAYFEGLR